MIGSSVHSLLLKGQLIWKITSFLLPLSKVSTVTALALVVYMLLTSHPKVKTVYNRHL